jgi:hypothetical protein
MSGQTADVLCEVAAERERQDMKWGEQNHPSGTGCWRRIDGGEMRRDGYLAEVRADRAAEQRLACDQAASEGRVTWRLILNEEIAEAIAEDEGANLRKELVQVAAVAVSWIEAIDRRAARSSPEGDR